MGERHTLALELPMHPREVGRGELRMDVALRIEPHQQRRVIERSGLLMGESGGFRRSEVVGYRAFGDAQGAGNLRVRESALFLESENFSNPLHGNPLGRHLDPLEQKGARVTSRFVELPRTASSIPRI